MRLTTDNITPTSDGHIVITFDDQSLTIHVEPDHYKRPLLEALRKFVQFVDVNPNPIDVENMLQIVCGATEKRS